MEARLGLKGKIRDFWIYKIGFPFIRWVERAVGRFSLVGDDTVLDVDRFSWSEEFVAGWPAIRRELDAVLVHRDRLPNLQEIVPDQASLTTDDGWKTFFLFAFGHRSEDNCRRCPETTRLLKRIPGLQTAFFSILSPDKHIPRHRGAYKGLIRCHLGLLVPEPRTACRMVLDGETVYWEEGRLLVFDNTRDHEVWNDTDRIRVVLLFDLVRPLRFPMSIINTTVIRLMGLSTYIREARRNHARWERRVRIPDPTVEDARSETRARTSP